MPDDLTPAASLDEFLAVRAQIDLLEAKLELRKPVVVVELIALEGGRVEYCEYERSTRSRLADDYSTRATAMRHCWASSLKPTRRSRVTGRVNKVREA